MALLPIYLQDHLALASAGIRLARRCRRENRGEGELPRFLDRLVPELEQDRAILVEAAHAIGARPDRLKEAAAVAGELIARLKLNGHLVTYSDLSRLWELEGLLAGSHSRRSAWKILARLQPRDPRLQGFAFDSLEERARAHVEALERFHARAAEVAFKARMRVVNEAEAPAR